MSALKFKAEEDSSISSAFSMSFFFLSLALWEPLSPDMLLDLKKSESLQDWPVRPQNPDTESGIGLILEFLQEDPAAKAEDLREDFTRLFTGPGSALAPPYESVYLGREKILFEAPTLDVRNIYRKFHLRIRSLNRIPDDHISCELAFLSELCSRFSDVSDNESSDSADDLRRFLESHLLLWSDMFIDRVIKHARLDFYRGIALLLRGTLEAFSSYIEKNIQPGCP
jgi:TorA maturation chaperone TorD